MWLFNTFSVTDILREIKSESKNCNFDHVRDSEFELSQNAKMFNHQNSEVQKPYKYQILRPQPQNN